MFECIGTLFRERRKEENHEEMYIDISIELDFVD